MPVFGRCSTTLKCACRREAHGESVLPRLMVVALFLGVALAGCASPSATDRGGAGATTSTTQVGGPHTDAPGPATAPTSGTTAGLPGPLQVSIIDNQFQPNHLSVAKGGSVRFTNDGMSLHTVTIQAPDGSPLEDSQVNPGEQTTVDFDMVGTYKLRCKIHSSDDFSAGQVGTIAVS